VKWYGAANRLSGCNVRKSYKSNDLATQSVQHDGRLCCLDIHELSQPHGHNPNSKASFRWLQRLPARSVGGAQGTERIMESGTLPRIINRPAIVTKSVPPKRELVAITEFIPPAEMVKLLRSELRVAVSFVLTLPAVLPNSGRLGCNCSRVLMNPPAHGIEGDEETGGVLTVFRRY